MTSLFVRLETLGEAFFCFLLRLEPKWIKAHPARYWVPIVAMLAFVFVDNVVPFDPRIRFSLTSFEVDTNFSLLSILSSLSKLKHIIFFFLLYIQLKQIWLRGEAKIAAFSFVLGFAIELEQAFIAGREARPADLLANLIGYLFARAYLSQRSRRGKAIYYSELE